jgi:hypothetical protein
VINTYLSAGCGLGLLLAGGLWLGWPWLAPLWVPATRLAASPDLLVILDGTPIRWAQAERIAAALPRPPRRLLIRCPRSPAPTQPVAELLQGFDTATQITALAHWLRSQPAPLPPRVWIATHPDHTARAVLLARLALGGRGFTVGPASPPPPGPHERLKLWRDAIRLSLWRATGSTGAWVVPHRLARKRATCGL